MLASTPLHLLVLDAVRRPLVMTSGNLTDEPIAASNDEARSRLGGIADHFLLHDREIVARCDDSVLRPAASGPVFLRRARGYAPLPFDLPVPAPVPLLAVGAQLKHTFALAQGGAALQMFAAEVADAGIRDQRIFDLGFQWIGPGVVTGLAFQRAMRLQHRILHSLLLRRRELLVEHRTGVDGLRVPGLAGVRRGRVAPRHGSGVGRASG
jgi:hypothetical protein